MDHMAGRVDLEIILSIKNKSEPPANKKLIIKLHNKWCRDNGYPIRKNLTKKRPNSGRNKATSV